MTMWMQCCCNRSSTSPALPNLCSTLCCMCKSATGWCNTLVVCFPFDSVEKTSDENCLAQIQCIRKTPVWVNGYRHFTMFLTTGFPALKIWWQYFVIWFGSFNYFPITFWNLTARLLITYHISQFQKKCENNLNSKTDRLDFFLNLVDTTSMVWLPQEKNLQITKKKAAFF